jgi:hypothetical protein
MTITMNYKSILISAFSRLDKEYLKRLYKYAIVENKPLACGKDARFFVTPNGIP